MTNVILNDGKTILFIVESLNSYDQHISIHRSIDQLDELNNKPIFMGVMWGVISHCAGMCFTDYNCC